MYNMSQKSHSRKGKNLISASFTNSSSAAASASSSSSCARRLLFCFVAIVFILLSFSPQQFTTAQQSLTSLMQKFKISENLIPISSSTSLLSIQLNGNQIKPGDPVPSRNFKNLEVSSQSVSWGAEDDAFYTLMLLDLKTNGTDIRNLYTTINIPGKKISSGQGLVVYEPPSVPCQPTTKHRIVALTFLQDQLIDLVDIAYLAASAGPRSSAKRENINLNQIILKHRLNLEAANLFYGVGDASGSCSASSTLFPNTFLTSLSIAFVMVMLQRLLSSGVGVGSMNIKQQQ